MKLRAVMVWIHGGYFTVGSSSAEFYGPDFLIEEDVVVVTVNYRLGVLGKMIGKGIFQIMQINNIIQLRDTHILNFYLSFEKGN